jgi:23S rRNA (adenine2503-C2)-methyltransferase
MKKDQMDIRNYSFDELMTSLEKIGEKSFRAIQIFEWIYQKGAWSFDEMRNLPKPLREKLAADFLLQKNTIIQKLVSADGTTKFLFDLADHERVEAVLIPTAKRTTACISTQAGCKLACRFCASGMTGWSRNLTTAEIVTQVLQIKEESANRQAPLSNIVFMGTGEPFDNFDNLMKAIRIINSPKGLGIGARHITISTVGIIPKIKELAQEKIQVELAISLHGYDEASRNALLPINKKYPLSELIAACREYIRLTNRQITFEYVLIKGLTCTKAAAPALGKLLKGLICKMNLIPYNSVAELGYESPSQKEILEFKDDLIRNKIHAIIRTPRGQDVSAACGQLRHQHQSKTPQH